MKKDFKKLSMIVVALAAMTFFNSCLKNKSGDNTPQPRAGVSILHASPGAPAADVFMNGDQINQGGKGIGFTDGGSIQQGVEPAYYEFEFKSAADNSKVLGTSSKDSLSDGKSYSVILYDTGSAKKVMIFQNTFQQSQSRGSHIRFLQLSPDLNSVSVSMDDSPFATDRSFADNLEDPSKAEFKVRSGATYTFTAKDGDGNVIDEVTQELQTNYFYTLYLDGTDSTKTAVDSLQWKLRFFAIR